MYKIAAVGATLTGNKGAASMLIALVQNVKKVIPADCLIDCLTIYPRQDKKFNFYQNLKIVKCTPFDIICIAFPLAVLYSLFARVRPVKTFLLKNEVLKTIYTSDLVVNISGISYSDGRGLVLLYNIVCDLIPVCLGKKTFKYSQALGPFNDFLNRLSARKILPRVTKIAARGENTIRNLQGLGLTNYEYCPDAAFLMDVDSAHLSWEMINICGKIKDSPRLNIGIAPSSVVEKYCSGLNIAYIDIMADFIKSIAAADYRLILFPYCCVTGRKNRKNNDLWTVKSIFEKIKGRENVVYIDEEYSAEDLKYLISCCGTLVTSRYHGMVTALSAEVVPLVIGWSHKYEETLNEFSLADLCIGYRDLNAAALKDKFLALMDNYSQYKDRIITHLPEQKKASSRNFVLIKELLEN